MSTLAEPVAAELDNPTLIIHGIAEAGDLIALCGARLQGVPFPRGTPLDCPVCEELEGQGW